MRRSVLKVLVAFLVVTAMGMPVVAAAVELAAAHEGGDDCASECAGDCSDEGTDGSCPAVCSFCCCASVVLPSVLATASFVSMPPSAEMTFGSILEPLVAPPPTGVFHPPRPQD